VYKRQPLISNFIEDKSFFKVALVVHVDLSVLIWLLSGAAVIWMHNIYAEHHSQELTKKYHFIQMSIKLLAKIAFSGIVLIAISPIIGDYEHIVIMNNYIPMFENICFITGLSVFITSIIVLSLITASRIPGTHNQYAGFIGSIIFLISLLCVVISYNKISRDLTYPIDLHGFYEMLFWSGGHGLQFLYLHIMYFAWITVLDTQHKFPNIQILIMWINLVAIIPLVPIHFMYNIDSPEFIRFCTEHMRYAGGIVASLMLLSTIAEILYANRPSKFLFGIYFSILLFTLGGIIGILISEVNVTIPAHYHGSIVGITIALMTMIYWIINLSDQEIKFAKTQITTYSIGQILHIGGLALSGGYGVLRKNPDMELPLNAKITMGILSLIHI
jgi:hypothetical protein